MMWIKYDENNYIVAFASEPQEGYTEVEAPTDFNDFFDYWNCYQYVEGQLIRNNNAINQQQTIIEEKAELAELRERLAATNDKILEALENLFDANSLTGIISVLVNSAKSLKTTLEERKAIRQRIAEILTNIGG